jgi:hypothetical protein
LNIRRDFSEQEESLQKHQERMMVNKNSEFVGNKKYRTAGKRNGRKQDVLERIRRMRSINAW